MREDVVFLAIMLPMIGCAIGFLFWVMSIPPIPPRVIKTEAERAFMENCLVRQDRHTCWANWDTLNAP